VDKGYKWGMHSEYHGERFFKLSDVDTTGITLKLMVIQEAIMIFGLDWK